MELCELKQKAYKQATSGNLPQSIEVEAMKAFALLTIAEVLVGTKGNGSYGDR